MTANLLALTLRGAPEPRLRLAASGREGQASAKVALGVYYRGNQDTRVQRLFSELTVRPVTSCGSERLLQSHSGEKCPSLQRPFENPIPKNRPILNSYPTHS